MRPFAPLALGLCSVFGMAQPQAPPPPLASLIQQALDRNPELARASALAEADRERIPQAKALPDPSLTLGLQNDGFKKLQVGQMETSYYQVMLTQPLPWPGKRNLRGEIARLGADASRALIQRTRLSLTAEVKRAYHGLLLVRGQRALLDQQALFWQQASAITKARYEVGQGSQADLLRSQLEQNRLRQRRIALEAEETILLAALNRLRGMPSETPIPTIVQTPDQPPSTSAAEWIARAEQESPELQSARLGSHQAERSLELARRDRFPDFAVSAGVMPRGSLEPMWQVGVSIALPVWSSQKQHRAVAEQEFRRRASGSELENLRNLLTQRIYERSAQLEAALETVQLYRAGLLVQSEASFQASLAQYEAGRAPFLSVLEALNGWLADQSGCLQALAQAQASQIAQEEFNLAGTPPITSQGLTASAIGMGGNPSGAGGSPSSAKSGAAASAAAPAMNAM